MQIFPGQLQLVQIGEAEALTLFSKLRNGEVPVSEWNAPKDLTRRSSTNRISSTRTCHPVSVRTIHTG